MTYLLFLTSEASLGNGTVDSAGNPGFIGCSEVSPNLSGWCMGLLSLLVFPQCFLSFHPAPEPCSVRPVLSGGGQARGS